MITDVDRHDTDHFALSQYRNVSVLSSTLKRGLFLLLLIYALNFAREMNSTSLQFELCFTRHFFLLKAT